MNAINQVWICQQNIQLFDRQLGATPDGSDRTLLARLRQTEAAKLEGLKKLLAEAALPSGLRRGNEPAAKTRPTDADPRGAADSAAGGPDSSAWSDSTAPA
jgi:hypothetical protein